MSEPNAPDDAALGRLLAEGLGRASSAPVDDDRLLSGARRGAERIRRRRRTGLTLATLLVLGTPVGLIVSELVPQDSVTSAGSGAVPEAASNEAASSLAVPGTSGVAAADDQGGAAKRADPYAATTVPDTALLSGSDLTVVALRRTSDTAYQGPVPALPATDTCGTALAAGPAAALGRAVVLERPTGSVGSSWLLASTVQVFAGGGAQGYAATATRLGCVTRVAVVGGEDGVVGHAGPDAHGRTHWYAMVRVGRVVTEVRLVVPRGAAVGQADVVRLLRLAGQRATSSGLVAAAAADPALT